MKDKHKTKEQLVNELVELRQRIIELEASETERVRAEEELKTQARILESMVEGVNVSDENAILLFTNPAFDAMFGYE